MKTAAVRGRPFQEGIDHRRGRGPRKGALNAGRPPNEFKAQLAALASREQTIQALAAILEDPNHPHFIQALKFAADRGYGKAEQSVCVQQEPAIVIVAPKKLTNEEWLARFGPDAVVNQLPKSLHLSTVEAVEAQPEEEPFPA